MSTGLDASTVTPGRTAPLVSLTTPVNALCARAAAGASASTSATTRVIPICRFIPNLLVTRRSDVWTTVSDECPTKEGDVNGTGRNAGIRDEWYEDERRADGGMTM